MRPRGDLTRWSTEHRPPPAAQDAIAAIYRILTEGCTAEDRAMAQAAYDAPPRPCHPQGDLELPL
jgi:hypothetical protein